LLSATLLERWPIGLPCWITTKQLVRFRKNKFDEKLCKLDSSEYARLFEQKSSLP